MNGKEQVKDVTIAFRRSYLVGSRTWDKLKTEHNDSLQQERIWTESFYDTKSSSLSHAECILTKDSDSPKYWKFFCFARDNIMEITTDEQDIKEPLSRINNFRSSDYITSDMMQPFFDIGYKRQDYVFDQFKISVTKSDYGFAFCTVQKDNVPLRLLPKLLNSVDLLAKRLELQNLSKYESKDFL
uniref:Uncharacterized protein n=1 Tax=Plectus sambesii TaxID=2011161 RepID=A0A914WGZ4_9BILA